MYKLVWTNSFVRTFKKASKTKPLLIKGLENTLYILLEDPFHPSLQTHKLKGALKGTMACSIDLNHRVVFEIHRTKDAKEDEIVLLSFGTHDEVY